jgi:hypothetical protein
MGVKKKNGWGEYRRIPQAAPHESSTENRCEKEGIGHFPALLPHFHRYYYYYVFIS